MLPKELPEDIVLSDAQVREVIELAARAVPPANGVSLAELRQIALELDIEERALENALRVVLGRVPAPTPIRSWLSTLATRLGVALSRFFDERGVRRRWLAFGAVGGTLGWFSAYSSALLYERVINGMTIRTSSTFLVDAPITALLILITLANSLSRRVEGDRTRYLLDTAATWFAFSTGWALTYGAVTDDLMGGLATFTAALGLWGWLIIRPSKPGDDVSQLLQVQEKVERWRASGQDDEPNVKQERASWKGHVSPTMLGLPVT